MTAATSDSEVAAKAHVAQIRSRMGLGEGFLRGWNESNLARALEVISKEINHDSTHFILEFIQNADDNTYSAGTTPSLEFTYHQDHLRVDCNEVGFLEKNVDAICSIGKSTKVRSDTGNSVGEKGIGFKSVFKVADKVYVASNSYQFMFDRHDTLGMIAPKWATIPVPRRAGYTTFLLEYSPECDRVALRKELESLDPRMLLFLHKLRNITVKFANMIDGPGRFISRSDTDAPVGIAGWRLVSLQVGRSSTTYAMVDHIARNLPTEEKRANVTTSQITLAFPVEVKGTVWVPRIEPQQVYAYLPIRDYGFEFLLQADLVLNAGREDVAGHNEWNQALRQASIDAVIEAVRVLAQGPMKYNWFRYLPHRVQETGFFKGYATELQQRISKEPLFRSLAATYECANKLTYVPSVYTRKLDDSELPLLMRRDNQASFLSPSYESQDVEKLRSLGVQEMDHASFLRELHLYLSSYNEDFRSRSNAWHSRLAQILAADFSTKITQTYIHGMRLIPLRDGQWVSGTGSKLYFSGGQQGFIIPDGLHFNVVNAEAEADPNRAHLFRLLEVTQLNPHKICEAILEKQDRNSFLPAADELLSQALFLYSMNYRSDLLRKIWLVAENGDPVRAGDLYADISVRSHTEGEKAAVIEYPARFFYDRVEGCKTFKFLHRRFLHPGNVDDVRQWHRYLHYNLHVAYAPRLVQFADGDKTTFSLHNDFAQAVKGSSATQWLSLLRNHWRLYSEWLENDETEDDASRWNRCRARLREKLGATDVNDVNGNVYPLKDTFLPLSNLVTRYNGIVPFLDINNPDDPVWQTTLRPFGVGAADNLQFYLKILQGAKSKKLDLDKITDILAQIQARSRDDEVRVRSTFKDQALICIPQASGLNTWTHPNRCVWKGPKCMRKFPALADLYPQLVQLFCNTLDLKDAEIEDLVKEISLVQLMDPLSYITELFLELEKLIKDDTPERVVSSLKGRFFLPIHQTNSSQYVLLASASGAAKWYIPDRPYLEDSFRGKIPLLAFSASETTKMKRLLRLLHLDTRKLSNCVTGTARTEGTIVPFREWTDSLRAKADCILRLVPDTTLNRRRIFQQLREVEVFTAPKVVQNWSILHNGIETVGKPQAGRVAMTANDEGLKIYFVDGALGTARCKWEFTALIADFCGISNDPDSKSDAKSLLMLILNEGQVGEINEILDTNSVPPLITDDDLVDEEERASDDKRTPRKKVRATVDYVNPFAHLSETVRNRIRVFTAGDPLPFDASRPPRSPLASPRSPGTSSFPHLPNVRVPLSHSFFSSRRNSSSSTPSPKEWQHAAEGEVIVSDLLRQILKAPNATGSSLMREHYEPVKHWTSIYRTHSGYPAFTTPNSLSASFTIAPSPGSLASAILTQYLYLEQRFTPAREWLEDPPTYHIEVKTTTENLDAEFGLSNEEFQRARRYRIENERPKDVVLMIRVWDVQSETPRVEILPDVWGWVEQGALGLRAVPEFRGRVAASGSG